MKDAPEGEVRIVADRLTKRFGDFVAVNEVSFEAPRGEIMGFLGPNGAGKSTIIRVLCGLLRPSGGRAEVAGVDVARYPERVREHIGYMSQKFSLYGDLSVVENLRFFGGVYGVKGERLAKRLAFAIDMAGLKGREGALVADLSGGWKQRLALGLRGLARARHPVPRRADLGRRPHVAPPLLGPDPHARGRGRVRGHHHPLHGRGRILQSDRAHQRRQARGARQPERAQAQRHPRRNPARRRRRSRRDAGSARGRAGVRDAAPFGSSLHIMVDDAARDPPAIEAALSGARPSLVAHRADQADARGRVRAARRRRSRAGSARMNFGASRRSARRRSFRSGATRAA